MTRYLIFKIKGNSLESVSSVFVTAETPQKAVDLTAQKNQWTNEKRKGDFIAIPQSVLQRRYKVSK